MIAEVLDIITVKTPAWMKDAACSCEDPELFFSHPGAPDEPQRAAVALSICRRCPVRVQCLTWAFQEQDQWAIMGGKTPRERVEILKAHTPRLKYLRDQIMRRLGAL